MHRPEGAARVAARMQRLGFDKYSLCSRGLDDSVRWYLPKFACGWTVDSAGGQAKLRWKGHALVGLTCWRAGQGAAVPVQEECRWICCIHGDGPCTCLTSRRGFFLNV